MARRSEGWNVGLVHDLQDSKFAREFLSAVEKGFPVQVPLGKIGSCHGREGIPREGCRRQARTFRVRSTPRHNPTQDTRNRLLRPLKLALAPLEPSNWIHRFRPKRLPSDHARGRGSTPVIARSR
jgi:hypothetical protein